MPGQTASLLTSIAADVERREQALIKLAIIFDQYIEATHGGIECNDDEFVVLGDIEMSLRRLENAICNAIGIPPRHEDVKI